MKLLMNYDRDGKRVYNEIDPLWLILGTWRHHNLKSVKHVFHFHVYTYRKYSYSSAGQLYV